MGHPDEAEWLADAAAEKWFDEQLQHQIRQPVFAYLAKHGDAVQERIEKVTIEATQLRTFGFPGAALVRTAAGIEIAIRFLLVRPLLLGAFMSDEWAGMLTKRVLGGRTVEDRELLPAILRNWQVDLTAVLLPDGSQMWQCIKRDVWPARNAYVHTAAIVDDEHAALAAECLKHMLTDVVAPIARNLGFTREESGCWSVVHSAHDRDLNSPTRHERANPFSSEAP